ncbi:MAG: hypothetical protein ACHQUB_01300 [Candidatus Saccharimonadia bacterium]
MYDQIPSAKSEVNIFLISSIFLGVMVVVVAIIAIVIFGNERHVQSQLSIASQTYIAQGKATQLKTDQQNALIAGETPFRDYVAPELYGGFDIKFPKDWNAYVIEDDSQLNQVVLYLNPSFVTLSGQNPATNSYAFRAVLINERSTTVIANLVGIAKTNGVTNKSVTVSGIASTWYDGKFDQFHNGVLVLVPVRDKTLELITDTHDYLTEFNQILAQSTIVK